MSPESRATRPNGRRRPALARSMMARLTTSERDSPCASHTASSAAASLSSRRTESIFISHLGKRYDKDRTRALTEPQPTASPNRSVARSPGFACHFGLGLFVPAPEA